MIVAIVRLLIVIALVGVVGNLYAEGRQSDAPTNITFDLNKLQREIEKLEQQTVQQAMDNIANSIEALNRNIMILDHRLTLIEDGMRRAKQVLEDFKQREENE